MRRVRVDVPVPRLDLEAEARSAAHPARRSGGSSSRPGLPRAIRASDRGGLGRRGPAEHDVEVVVGQRVEVGAVQRRPASRGSAGRVRRTRAAGGTTRGRRRGRARVASSSRPRWIAQRVSSTRLCIWSLRRVFWTWFWTVRCEITSRSAICLYSMPFATILRISVSRSVSRGAPSSSGVGSVGDPAELAQHQAGEARGEDGVALGDAADRADELLARGGLHEVAGRPGLHRLEDVGLLAGGGEDQHPRRRVLTEHLGGDLDPVGAGDLQVEDDDLGSRRGEARQRLGAVGGHAHHVEPGRLEVALHGVAPHRVVVDHHHPDLVARSRSRTHPRRGRPNVRGDAPAGRRCPPTSTCSTDGGHQRRPADVADLLDPHTGPGVARTRAAAPSRCPRTPRARTPRPAPARSPRTSPRGRGRPGAAGARRPARSTASASARSESGSSSASIRAGSPPATISDDTVSPARPSPPRSSTATPRRPGARGTGVPDPARSRDRRTGGRRGSSRRRA